MQLLIYVSSVAEKPQRMDRQGNLVWMCRSTGNLGVVGGCCAAEQRHQISEAGGATGKSARQQPSSIRAGSCRVGFVRDGMAQCGDAAICPTAPSAGRGHQAVVALAVSIARAAVCELDVTPSIVAWNGHQIPNGHLVP